MDRPYHVPGAQDIPVCRIAPDLRLLAALALFRAERVSSGRAAEIAGLSKCEFINALDRHGIPYFTETPEELKAQVVAVREVLRESEDCLLGLLRDEVYVRVRFR